VSDYFDDSDEEGCQGYNYFFSYTTFVLVVIQFNRYGYYESQWMVNDTCPESNYRCVGQPGLCLPVYTRCNGYFDCLNHEDDLDCDSFQCPGYYRCLDSQICLHPDHVCDGWPQCDDEWLCDVKPCPETCLCHGLAFVCDQPFQAGLYPQMRYLDGTGSGMTPHNLTSNVYLIHLVLSTCGLQTFDANTLLNLKYLDLSLNQMQTINMDVFLNLVNLETL
jgi:hypothetical protein